MNEINLNLLQELIDSQKLITRYYNIHNLIKLKIVSAKRKFIEFFEKEYSIFRTDKELEPQIELIFCNFQLNLNLKSLKFLGNDYYYNDQLSIISGIRARNLLLRKRVEEIAILGSTFDTNFIFLCREDILPEYIQSNVLEPVFRIYFNLQGYELVHSSCVCDRKKGYLFPAWRNTGKTSIMLHFCLNEGFDFISDDWTILSQKGELLTYPRPIQIFEYNLKEYPNLLNRFFHSKLKRFVFKGKLKISRRKIEAGVISKKIQRSCPLHTVIMPIRWSNDKIRILKNVNKIELAQKIVSCANYEHHALYRHLFSSNFQLKFSIEDLIDLFKSQVQIVRNALQNSVCHEIYIPKNISFKKVIEALKELIE